MMKENKPDSAKEYLMHRLKNSGILEFMLSRFIEYFSDVQDWRTKLTPVREEFQKYIEVVDPDGERNLSFLVHKGLMFMATHPLFSGHEYAKLGAEFTSAEKQQFIDELAKISSKPSKRQQVQPLIAAVGWEIIDLLMKSTPSLAKEIATKKAEMDELLAAGIIKAMLSKAEDPWIKALKIIDRLEDLKITMDEEGNITDPNGLVEREFKQEENARKSSKAGTSEEGTEGLPTVPENLN